MYFANKKERKLKTLSEEKSKHFKSSQDTESQKSEQKTIIEKEEKDSTVMHVPDCSASLEKTNNGFVSDEDKVVQETVAIVKELPLEQLNL